MPNTFRVLFIISILCFTRNWKEHSFSTTSARNSSQFDFDLKAVFVSSNFKSNLLKHRSISSRRCGGGLFDRRCTTCSVSFFRNFESFCFNWSNFPRPGDTGSAGDSFEEMAAAAGRAYDARQITGFHWLRAAANNFLEFILLHCSISWGNFKQSNDNVVSKSSKYKKTSCDYFFDASVRGLLIKL